MSTAFTLAVIPARAASRGLPGKNLRPLGGKPLLAHSIECARAAPAIDEVVVSTDSAEIAEVARGWGAQAPFLRPPELATDEAPMLPVLQHAVTACEAYFGRAVAVVVLLQPTSPLRLVEDVEACVARFHAGGCDAVISTVVGSKSPYFTMVVPDGEGYVRLLLHPARPIGRRQDAPPVYVINGAVYVFSRAALMEEQSTLPRRSVMYLMPAWRSIDIDSDLDLELAEYLLERRKGLRQPRVGERVR